MTKYDNLYENDLDFSAVTVVLGSLSAASIGTESTHARWSYCLRIMTVTMTLSMMRMVRMEKMTKVNC